jgi:hypothetical protein
MTPKFRTREVAKSFYTNYLKRCEECLHAAKNSLFFSLIFVSMSINRSNKERR